MTENLKLEAPELYNIAQDIDRHANDPGKMAILWENEAGQTKELTYAKLRQDSNKFANALAGLGLRKGDRIVVMLPRLPETYSVILGALKAGLVISPGSEMLMPKDLQFRIQHSEAKAVVSFHEYTDRFDQIRSEVPNLQHCIVLGAEKEGWLHYEHITQSESPDFEIVQTRYEDTAFLNYTSGTTGNPKGVIMHHGWGIGHQAVAAKLWMDIQENDVVWATAGPGWAKWNWSPFLSVLGSGAAGLCYQGKFDAHTYLKLIEKYNVNVLCCTPTEYRLMAKLEGLEQFKFPQLRSTVSAGEPLNQQVIEVFRQHFNVDVRDGYGQSENSLLIGHTKGTEIKPGAMGKPAPGYRISIIDEDGNEVPKGQVGDIAIHKDTPILFRGYLNDPVRTNAAFRGEWYVTGDQAKADEDGYFWFEGRSDDIIISSGYTIGPFEVEDALVKHPAVKECAVVASPDEIRGSVVKAFVTLKDPNAASDDLIKQMQEHVKSITAPYKYPREIEFVSDLPKTVSGKIRRVELRALEKTRKAGIKG